MNCVDESLDVDYHNTNTMEKKLNQSSLEMFEYYSLYKDKPYLRNPVIGLVHAVTNSKDYIGAKNLEKGNHYLSQGNYSKAIEFFILNTLPESTNRKYTLNRDIRKSLVLLAICYLRLGNISMAINYYQRALENYRSSEFKETVEVHDPDLFEELCLTIKYKFHCQIAKISNSLDLFEFVSNIIDDHSGWELALQIMDVIISNKE